MLNALKMNRKAFTRKENPIPADKNQTLTQIEPSMPKQRGGGALSGGMGFSFRVKALRFIFEAFSIRLFYTCFLHVPFMFPCTRSFCKNTLFPKKYFDCLPLEFDSYELLRTLKMISESVRIFL